MQFVLNYFNLNSFNLAVTRKWLMLQKGEIFME